MQAPEQVQTPEEKAARKRGIGSLWNLHNQARLMSVILFVTSVLITAAYWDNRINLMNYQYSTAYVSVGCTAVLLFGTIVSIPILYVPAVYIMRLGMIKICVLNTFLLVEILKSVDTFVVETALRSKSSTVQHLNRNFSILARCFKLSIQVWICIIIFCCLQLIAKDYHRLRAKAKKDFDFVGRLERNVMAKIRRVNEPRPVPRSVEETVQLDGTVVKVAYPVVTVETQHHCKNIDPEQQQNEPLKQNHESIQIIHEHQPSGETPEDAEQQHQPFGFPRLFH